MPHKKVDPPSSEEAALVEDRTLISLLFPAQSGDLVKQLEGQGSTVMAMDCIPRTLSRGQTYDALSSQVRDVAMPVFCACAAVWFRAVF